MPLDIGPGIFSDAAVTSSRAGTLDPPHNMDRLARACLGACLFTLIALGLRAAPLPLEKLVNPPDLAAVEISPDGSKLILVSVHEREQQVVLLDLATMQPTVLGRLGFSRLQALWWAGNSHLLVRLLNPTYRTEYKSIDLASGKALSLVAFNDRWVNTVLRTNPGTVLVSQLTPNFRGQELRSIDLRSGRAKSLGDVPGNINQWLLSDAGEPVAAVERSETEKCFYLCWRPNGSNRWTKTKIGTLLDPDFRMLAVHPDQKRLLALDLRKSRSSLVALDPASLQTEVILAEATVDPETVDTWGEPGRKIRAVYARGAQSHRHFFDPAAADLQSQFERAFPQQQVEVASHSLDETRLVILVRSVQNPGQYFLFDRRAGKLMPLGAVDGSVKPAEMGTLRPFTFSASDGTPIHGSILLPPGHPERPPVVLRLPTWLLPTRESPDFDIIDQALATRGYAVAKIDRRGTAGYGHDFLRRGRGQLTHRSPQDLIEGIDWLDAQGWIDGNRAIICGERTGGWVAMQALARSERFAGWINSATPMDFDILQRFELSSPLRFAWDLWVNEDETKATGILDFPHPTELLAKIKVPSFHLYTESDHGVLSGRGLVVEAVLKKRATIAKRRWGDTIDQERANELRGYEQLFAFLAQHFPTPENQAAPPK